MSDTKEARDSRKRANEQDAGDGSPKKKKDDSLAGLPLTCSYDDCDNPFNIEATLQCGWSDTYLSKDAIMDAAMEYADPGGQVSLEIDCEEERIRELLERRGFVDVVDFIKDEDGNYPDDDDSDGYGEVGWNVKIKFEEDCGLDRALSAMGSFFSEFDDIEGDMDKEAVREVRTKARSLLSAASSIRHASIVHDYRHTDYPSGGKQIALQFIVEDDRQVELVMREYYESV